MRGRLVSPLRLKMEEERMEPILSIRNLNKVYPDGTAALTEVSFDVHPGEFVVVIGPSGAGKSTLLRCINRLVEPTEGTVQFKNQVVNRVNARQLKKIRREIGMVFQSFHLIDRLNVLNNVLHGRLAYTNTIKGAFGLFSKQDVEEAKEILKRVGLDEKMYSRADELSGGQMQRVGICRALAQKPQLILADEPIASLDPASSKTIMEYMYNICREDGITAVVNLHQVDVAIKYATRIIGIQNGKIVFDGPPQQLKADTIERLYYKETKEKKQVAGVQ